MRPELLFQIHLVLGYVAWFLCFRAYILPRLRSLDRVQAQRAIATLHSFRFFGLVFILSGFVGTHLPVSFAKAAAFGDLATGLLAIFVLLSVRIRPVFWALVATLHIVGIVDLLLAYYHAIRAGLPAMAGELGSAYAIPVLYVPLLMITHVTALYWMLRPHSMQGSGRSAVVD
jgi:hypothetical protein